MLSLDHETGMEEIEERERGGEEVQAKGQRTL